MLTTLWNLLFFVFFSFQSSAISKSCYPPWRLSRRSLSLWWTVNFWSRERFTVCQLSKRAAKRNSSHFPIRFLARKAIAPSCCLLLKKKKTVKSEKSKLLSWALRIALIKRKKKHNRRYHPLRFLDGIEKYFKRLTIGHLAQDNGMPVLIDALEFRKHCRIIEVNKSDLPW